MLANKFCPSVEVPVLQSIWFCFGVCFVFLLFLTIVLQLALSPWSISFTFLFTSRLILHTPTTRGFADCSADSVRLCLNSPPLFIKYQNYCDLPETHCTASDFAFIAFPCSEKFKLRVVRSFASPVARDAIGEKVAA